VDRAFDQLQVAQQFAELLLHMQEDIGLHGTRKRDHDASDEPRLQAADRGLEMRWSLAVARIPIGSVPDQWQPKDAFAMATSAGAQVLGRAHELGGLHRAISRTSSCSTPSRPSHAAARSARHDAGGRDVEHVLVDGKQVIQNGLPTMVDAARIRADAQRAAEALWPRKRREGIT
jgi:5-methylthioadenosine/S-adenosylhomocysteine deaminase